MSSPAALASAEAGTSVAIFFFVFATIPSLKHSSISRALLLAGLSLCAACAVPLGPGFLVRKELLEVRFVPTSPPHLEIRATFDLRNSGNAPLDSLDVSLPDEKLFGRSNLRVELDGALVSPRPAPDAPPSTLRVPFASPWPQKTQHTLVISYDLMQSADSPAPLGIADNSFFLSTEDWYPLPRAPKGLFAYGDARPRRFDLVVRVPDGFLVHAAGQVKGKRRRAAESEFRFRISTDDFFPFVVAGRYHEQQYKDSNGAVLFWTFQPLPADRVHRVGPALVSTAKNFGAVFGSPWPGKRQLPMRIVERRFPQGTLHSGSGTATFDHFPAGALIHPNGFAVGSASEDSLTLVEQSWPWTWAQDVARPSAAPDETLQHALIHYAALLAELSRSNGAPRPFRVQSFLRSFENLSATAKEIPVALLMPNDPEPQYAIGNWKAALFLVALEDEIGTDNLHRALRQMIQGLRGSTYSFTDLRSAAEVASGKNLAEFFRLWLNQPGIPADFRARYAAPRQSAK